MNQGRSSSITSRRRRAWPVVIDRTSDDQQVDPWGPWYLTDPNILAAGEPSHSIVGTAADVALFYQALFTSGLWNPEAVTEGSRIHNSAAAAGEKLYGGSDTVTHMALFCTVTNGYPIAGYDYSPAGRNRLITIGNLAGDLLA
jgi:hypothetical protein